MENEAGELTFKVTMLGRSGAGKTALYRRFNEEDMCSEYQETSGMHTQSKRLEIGTKIVTVQTFDLGSSWAKQAHPLSDCIALVCDVSQEGAEATLEGLVAEATKYSSTAAKVVIVTKCDLGHPDQVKAQEFAAGEGLMYFEVSALEDTIMDARQVLGVEVAGPVAQLLQVIVRSALKEELSHKVEKDGGCADCTLL
eukprot:TRINITY_DN1915_c0_g1_i1.p1 TRINITY_DN1915_c0_g1~~TRINITY_DN1915_c0_g1_i1.p1  ORF type:complete len:197 (+),score=46.01 TRINITY_DN1915_c0_g1_i1:231-821(+)